MGLEYTEDSDLISRTLGGDTAAFGGLVTRYQSFVFTLVLRYVKRRDEAEEVAQDVFVKAYRSLKDFRGGAKFSTWLYTIAATTALSHLRRARPDIRSLDEEGAQEIAQPSDLRADAVERKSRTELLARALDRLKESDAQVIRLFYQGEQSLEEIALIVGKDAGAVKVQLHRARTRLKEIMHRDFPVETKDLYLP